MMFNKTKIVSLSAFSSLGLFFASAAQAVCPVCTIGVVAGLGLARWLKIDDTITGLWIGGATVMLIMWTFVFLDKKNIKFPGRNIITIIAYYALVFWPLRSLELIGHEQHTIWGMDKLIFSIVLGSISLFGLKNGIVTCAPKEANLFPLSESCLATSSLDYLSIFLLYYQNQLPC